MFKSAAVAAAVLIMTAGIGMPQARAGEAGATLKFGTSVGYPPFEYLDENGKIAGFDIDIGNAICEHLNVKCEWVNIDFSGMVPALKARKFDAMLASVAITEDRLKQVDFSNEVYRGSTRLLARKESGMTLDVGTLKGKRIGVEQGTINERFAKARWAPEGVEVVAYANQDLIFSDLIAGRLDGVCVEGLQAQLGFLGEERGRNYGFVGDVIKDPLLGSSVSGIAMDKGNVKVLAAVNKGLDAIHADGTFAKIAAKYFPASLKIYGE
ncbi:transporter substrate-binding domain-containing protein [Rhizobium lusitanum]|uniref:transporter substrate-binding domain-containing protein n=1 Tax=Rhizobium lusitanum TaxID=293958 RepID=UPI001574CEED|nr:transporter substrate-binding domain-containing protein [Rhizobium lusitanum]NTJ11620.1 transporter substrate-binding domain-containing protein [Rhizobium lusitanum]